LLLQTVMVFILGPGASLEDHRADLHHGRRRQLLVDLVHFFVAVSCTTRRRGTFPWWRLFTRARMEITEMLYKAVAAAVAATIVGTMYCMPADARAKAQKAMQNIPLKGCTDFR
jgi:hypothetical protein